MTSKPRKAAKIVSNVDIEERLERAESEVRQLRLAAARYEARLAESQATYAALVEAVPDAIVLVDSSSRRIVGANPAAVEMFGYSLDELIGMKSDRLLDPVDGAASDRIERVLAVEGHAWSPEIRVHRKNGEVLACDVRITEFVAGGRQLRAAIARDVTHRNEQRSQLEQADRLAAIGRLSAGIAHEINNPSTVVLANAEAAELPIEDLERFVARLEGLAPAVPVIGPLLETHRPREAIAELRVGNEQTRHGILRVAAIVGDLMRFARVDRQRAPGPTDINEVVRAAMTMTRPEVRGKATLEFDEGAVPAVVMRSGEIGQILVNLISNAAHAIPDGDGREHHITIRTGAADGGVFCTVSDTGGGVQDEHRLRIFESFFTTKPTGLGTGLGLSISTRIAHEHGGKLSLESTSPEGSTFKLWLPDVRTIAPNQTGPYTPVPIGRLRILVVDDEPDVLHSLHRLLGSTHDVVTADGGQSALFLLDRDAEFDIILCDVMMPGVDGPACFEQIEARHPRLADRVVFMTGGLPSTRAREFVEQRGELVVAKPVTRDGLYRAFATVRRRTMLRAPLPPPGGGR